MTSESLISPAVETNTRGISQRDSFSSGLEATLLDPRSDVSWDRLVSSHPKSTIFHSAAWAEVLANTYGHKPFYLRLTGGDETVALIPLMEVSSPFTGRRGICLPFSDFCAPLTFGEYQSEELKARLVQLARQRNWKHLDIREAGTFQIAAGGVSTFYGHSLNLRGGIETIAARCGSSARRAIRKAEKSAVTVEVDRSRAGILEFYKLHALTRRRHGIPPQPASFFLNIYEHVIKRGLGFVVIARSQRKPVAAAVFLHFGRNALYKFAASDLKFQELRGNNLVIWEGIKVLVQQNSESLHFGRTSLDDNGLRQFKLSLGTEEDMIEYLRLETRTSAWVSKRDVVGSGFHKKLFSRLPLTLNRVAGTLIYPHLD